MSPLLIEAPTDAQLLYIARLCVERELPRPEVVASKAEGGEIIDALKAGTYDPGRYCWPFSMSSDDVPF